MRLGVSASKAYRGIRESFHGLFRRQPKAPFYKRLLHR
jgi:hypothetical protein